MSFRYRVTRGKVTFITARPRLIFYAIWPFYGRMSAKKIQVLKGDQFLRQDFGLRKSCGKVQLFQWKFLEIFHWKFPLEKLLRILLIR